MIGDNGVAVDGAGNVLIADGSRVRVVPVRTGTFYGQAMTARDIYTIAGQPGPGGSGYSGDGGPASAAKLFAVGGLTVDGAGNLVIADSQNSRIRVVARKTGTFYGKAMTAGDIYTVAGNGTAGFAGDGGPATSAELNLPNIVALDGSGNLVIADTFNSAIRVVAVTAGTFYGRPMTAGHIYTVAGTGSAGFSGDEPGHRRHLQRQDQARRRLTASHVPRRVLSLWPPPGRVAAGAWPPGPWEPAASPRRAWSRPSA
jgi:hypothetical protein